MGFNMKSFDNKYKFKYVQAEYKFSLDGVGNIYKYAAKVGA